MTGTNDAGLHSVKVLHTEQATTHMSLGKRIRKSGIEHTFSTAYTPVKLIGWYV